MKAKWKQFTKEEIAQFVAETKSFRQLNVKMGYKPEATIIGLKEYLEENEINFDHYLGTAWRSKGISETNDYGVITKSILKAKVLKERGCKCEKCGLTEWQNKPIPLEIHHLDGNPFNNKKENIQVLCPNCHALTENYCGKNTRRVTDEEVLKAAEHCSSINDICLEVGWNTDANHYAKVRKILGK